MIERFYQILENDNGYEQIQQKLRNIMHYRVLDHMEMIALVHQLPSILRGSPKVKLLIVDSVAYHLRLNIRQNRTRVGLLNYIGQTLAQAATQFNLAIVVTSHVSTDITIGRLRPALGNHSRKGQAKTYQQSR
ncbi:hypothetical protein BCR42DRAFT_58915 [Absidia repens]|uniref:DNA repair protein RAD51 homolog 3 n=1 Tax=Absidia repens TaxID=90262 RepID=A0A1X2ICJ0_9FUNG|nr:hypothetical protein BCR42DRAFT_58915 [Absidia repens]